MFSFFFIFFHVLSNLNSWGQSFGFDLTCHPATSASHGAATLLASGFFQVKLTQVVWPSMFDRRPAAGARCWCTEKLRVCGSQWLTSWYFLISINGATRSSRAPNSVGCLPGWQRHRTSSPWMWAFLELGEMMFSSICGFCWLFEYSKSCFRILVFLLSQYLMEIRAFTFSAPPVARCCHEFHLGSCGELHQCSHPCGLLWIPRRQRASRKKGGSCSCAFFLQRDVGIFSMVYTNTKTHFLT